ncbi:MAG: hypothetical protein AAGJ93_08020 [Bacteroidota bacterium]
MRRFISNPLLWSGVLAAVLISLVQHNPFFWDTISQASRRSSWFFGEGWGTILLPYEMDSGHPTGFNLYLAGVWKLFGRSLVASHWAMLPIVWGIIYQIHYLVEHYFSAPHRIWAKLLVLTDVTLLAQATLVAPDLVILLGYLLGIRGIFFRKSGWIILGSTLMVSVSLRGIFCLAALGLSHVFYHYLVVNKKVLTSPRIWWSIIQPFLPAILLLIGFNAWHFLQTGWILNTPNPAWAGHRELLSIKGAMRNVGIIGWRLLDFGRWAYWLVFGTALWLWWRNKPSILPTLKSLLLWPGIFLVVLSTAMILLSNPITHRYFLPALISLTFLGAFIVLEHWKTKRRWWVYTFLLLSQLSGHCWIYPPQVAQAWDASLAYLPYFHLKEEAVDFAYTNQIPLDSITSEFPAVGPLDWTTLNEKTEGFVYRDENSPFLFYTTVMNDFADKELAQMAKWPIVWEESYWGHRAVIYERKINH